MKLLTVLLATSSTSVFLSTLLLKKPRSKDANTTAPKIKTDKIIIISIETWAFLFLFISFFSFFLITNLFFIFFIIKDAYNFIT